MSLSVSHRSAKDPPEAGKPQEGLELTPQSPEPESHHGGKDLQDTGKGRTQEKLFGSTPEDTWPCPRNHRSRVMAAIKTSNSLLYLIAPDAPL